MAPTKTQALIALLGMTAVHGQDTGEDAITCFSDTSKTFFMGGAADGDLQVDGQAPNFKNGLCCADDCPNTCTVGAGFCASGASGTNPINNRFLKEFMRKADSTNCPDDTEIVVTQSGAGGAQKKQHNFAGTLPNIDAKNWHCKWKISAPSLAQVALSDTDSAREGNGWIELKVVAKGFDKNVIVIMQPPEALYDFNFRDLGNNPEKASYVGKSQTGRTYVLPAEYDIFVDVSPYGYNANSNEESTTDGFVQIQATHFTTNPMPAADSEGYSTWSEALRITQLVDPSAEEEAEAPDEDAPDIAYVDVADDSEIPEDKKDLDGNIISVGERWGTGTAFTIGDTKVTKEQAAAASGIVVALIIIVVVMCLFFSWIERKKIAEEGRRLSTAVRRASTKLRRGSSANEAPEKEMTDKDIEKAAGKAAGSKTEKNFLQDQMKYQRDANQASATSIHGEDAAGITKQNKSIDGLPKPDTEYKDPVE